jgi:hypothetical protein
VSKKRILSRVLFGVFVPFLLIFTACRSVAVEAEQGLPTSIEELPSDMTWEEVESLTSLEQIDPYPLYTMHFLAEYDTGAAPRIHYADPLMAPTWSCSLFAVLGDPDNMLFGRNFDWDFSPGLLLLTDPPGGYASVSMVDLHYLGYGGEGAFGLTDLPLPDRAGLLMAPHLPFDGMNEAGVVVGMAAVPERGMEADPSKETIDSLMVIRKVLDNAASVDEAVEIIKMYNIDWGSGPPLHYLVADKSGRAVLVEFSADEVVVIPNFDPWQPATNFLVSEATTDPRVHCRRYGLIADRLTEHHGILSQADAMELLEDVSQDSTQWSVVYGISSGEVDIVMGGNYGEVHTLKFQP